METACGPLGSSILALSGDLVTVRLFMQEEASGFLDFRNLQLRAWGKIQLT
jgi:hypothetical protein